jgi:hypothetical protein
MVVVYAWWGNELVRQRPVMWVARYDLLRERWLAGHQHGDPETIVLVTVKVVIWVVEMDQ